MGISKSLSGLVQSGQKDPKIRASGLSVSSAVKKSAAIKRGSITRRATKRTVTPENIAGLKRSNPAKSIKLKVVAVGDTSKEFVFKSQKLEARSELQDTLAEVPVVVKKNVASVATATFQNSFVVNPQIFRPRPISANPTRKPEVFKAGDKIVYPGHGVGILDEVITRSVGGEVHTFYGLTILDSKQTKIMVPVSQAHSVGLRKIVSMRQMQEVFELLRGRPLKVENQTWNRRARDYTLKLKTGSLFEIAEVTRELAFLAKTKELSFGEKKMLESAQYLLVSELALVKSRSHEVIFGRASRSLELEIFLRFSP